MSGNSEGPGRNLVLIGFMGAGKSTVARHLARRTGYRRVDLDALVEEREGKKIREIFAQRGEAAFRSLETEALRSLEGARRTVVATGGGIVGRPENWNLMRRLGTVVFLDVPWPTLQARIGRTDHRPLAAPEQGWETVRKLWEERLPLYRKADLCIEAGGLPPAATAAEILARTGVKEP